MRWTAPHSMRRRHTVVAAVFLWGACVWLRSSSGRSLALGPALRGAPEIAGNLDWEIASAASPSSTFVYIGADLDVHMLKYLAEDETRAVYMDPLSEGHNELGDSLDFNRHHAHDPRPSFRRDSSEFRPFRTDRIHAFRDKLRDRFRDEGFQGVHLRVAGPRTVAGSFVLDKIRRKFVYMIIYEDAAALPGHHVTTYVTLGIVSDVPGAWKRTIRRRIMGRRQAPDGAVIYPLHDYPAGDTQAGTGSRPVMVVLSRRVPRWRTQPVWKDKRRGQKR